MPDTHGPLHADVAQLVERRLAKAKVAGSNPVIRSTRLRALRALRRGFALELFTTGVTV